MGEHGHWQKTTLFENATRVPLVISGPGVLVKGGVAKGLAELVDIYPTMADLAQVKAPAQVSGVSLRPVVEDTKLIVRSSALTQYNNGYSIRTNRYRYTEWGVEGSLGAELYDHETDPEELINLIDDPNLQDLQMEMGIQLQSRVANSRKVPSRIKQIQDVPRRSVPQPNP